VVLMEFGLEIGGEDDGWSVDDVVVEYLLK
jgi:hypothetical protein